MNRFTLLAVAAVASLMVCNQAAQAITGTVNLARGGTASQSSTGFGGDASRAIDGGLGISYGIDKTTTHTNNEAGASWQVDLGGDRTIDSVELFSRGDCCNPLRLANYNVDILDNGGVVATQSFAGGQPVNSSQSFGFAGVTGDAVRVQLNGSNFLSLREVVVLGEDTVVNGSNLAGQYGTATQSSTRSGGGGNAAQFALDGNTNGSFGAGSVTHTNGEASPFWEVDLNGTFHVDNIRLHNRSDCCQGRLSNFDIEVLDEDRNVVATINNPGGPGTGFHAVAPGTEGRFVRVQLNGNDVLSLAEVEVNGGLLQNIARNGFASQSSTRVGGGGNAASVAIDGITNGVFFGDNSVTHTDASDQNATFDLDFNGSFGVEELVIFNRTDCCTERLSGAEISLFNGMGEVFATTLGNMAGVPVVRIDLGGNFAATSLQIRAANGNVLSLAEVQVFATQVPEPATFVLLGASGLFFARRRRRTA